MSDTVTAPEGYIGLVAAIDHYVRTALGGWEPDSYVKVRFNKAEAHQMGVRTGKVVERLDGRAGREQHRIAAEWLRKEFASEELITVIETTGGRRTLPASFWRAGPWRDTLHTGLVGHVEHVCEWQPLVGRPVFIERGSFEARLSAITDKPAGKRRRGRKPGDGVLNDEAAVAEGIRLLEQKPAKSLSEAARTVVRRADRGASPDADLARVRRKIREKLDTK